MKQTSKKGVNQKDQVVKLVTAADGTAEKLPNHPPHYDDEADVTGRRLFPLGKIVITRGAMASLTPSTVQDAIGRHLSGRWGNLCEQDKTANDLALLHGDRVVSKYRGENDAEFYIITEWDRSYTTILLTNEY